MARKTDTLADYINNRLLANSWTIYLTYVLIFTVVTLTYESALTLWDSLRLLANPEAPGRDWGDAHRDKRWLSIPAFSILLHRCVSVLYLLRSRYGYFERPASMRRQLMRTTRYIIEWEKKLLGWCRVGRILAAPLAVAWKVLLYALELYRGLA